MKDVLEAATIKMDRATARKNFLEYRAAVRERHNAEDAAIMRGYQVMSTGKQLIRLTEVIVAGGIFSNGMPRLAVAQSDHDYVYCTRDTLGAVEYKPRQWVHDHHRKGISRFPTKTLPMFDCEANGCDMNQPSYKHTGHYTNGHGLRAMVPNVPPGLRPAHSLSNYLTLFEVDKWERAPRPPGDPALLKHIGGDLYAVLAVWDLTALEQAVLAGRIPRV